MNHKFKLLFHKELLPKPVDYYSNQLDKLKLRGMYANARCPFPGHEDKNPSFSFNLKTGSFRCFGCGQNGGDVLDFHMKRYGLGFKDAAKELGGFR